MSDAAGLSPPARSLSAATDVPGFWQKRRARISIASWVLLAGFLASVSATIVWLGEGDAGPKWQEIEPGLQRMTLMPPDGQAELLRFDLERYEVDVHMPGPDAPETAAQVRARQRAVAALNGGFFDTDGRPLGLRIGGGEVLRPLRKRVDWGVLLVSQGRARIVHSRDFMGAEGVIAGIQVGPRLVVAGKAVKLKPQVARRSAVAVDEDGRSLTVLVTRTPMLAADLANQLVRLGYTDAMLLDGGPSTQLSMKTETLAIELAGAYPVPDLLVIRRR